MSDSGAFGVAVTIATEREGEKAVASIDEDSCKCDLSCVCACDGSIFCDTNWMNETVPQKRLEQEIDRLMIDIRRIGDNGSPKVKFGELFDDDDVQQYYEALVGTLKCAKKRGLIDYEGMLLLKGVSDNVVISIIENENSKN